MTTVATTIERELRSIWDSRGEMSPGIVVESAKPKNHPLHDQFEWDDKVAGPAYRCMQAAQLIRSVKIVLTTENGEIEDHKVRAWLPARYAGGDDAEPGRYLPTPAIESQSREFMLRQMRREAAAFRRRYGHLEAYWLLLDEMAAARTEDAV